MSEYPELYVLARSVLLDVLEALGTHRDAMILVGAQAVYLRAGASDELAVVPYTTDADLALNPSLLAERPALEALLTGAGLVPKGKDMLGSWLAHRTLSTNLPVEVEVDLLVPKGAVPGSSRRAANLKGHAKNTARLATGLEGALIDRDLIRVGSLDPKDPRTADVLVAGPAALIVAKLHKIQDRAGSPRQSDKDALDILRLLQALDHDDVANRFHLIVQDPGGAAVGSAAITLMKDLFGGMSAVGPKMAANAAAPLADSDEIKRSCVVLAASLLGKIES